MKTNSQSPRYSKFFLPAFFAASTLVFALILINRNPFLIRPMSVAVRSGYTLVAPAVFACLLLAYHPAKAAGAGTAMAATFILFAMVLNGLWNSGLTESVIISGLLPWSDSSSYYLDALGWLEGFKFQEKSAIRPIFAAFLSLLLSLTGKNLQFSIALLVLLISLAGYLFSQKVKEQFGFFAAAFALLLVFFYVRRICGTTLSENLGIVFSLLGYANLLVGAKTKKKGHVLLGAFLVSMSLNTRPGPFFIMIAVVLWSGLLFLDSSRESWKEGALMVLLSGLAVGLPFAVNLLIQKNTADNDVILFANFSYAFYGLVSGGKNFTQIFVDHPELRELPGSTRHMAIFNLAFEVLRTNPAGFIQGCFKYLKDFLLPTTWYSIFGYVGNDASFLANASRAVLEGLSLFTLSAFLRKRRDPLLLLITLVMLGTLLSVPFVPPGDAHKLRLYSAVIPVIALLPPIGFLELLELAALFPPLKRFQVAAYLKDSGEYEFPNAPIMVLAIVLCLVVTASPFLSRAITAPSSFTPVTCPEGQQAAYFEHRPGSHIFIWPEEAFFLDWMPNFHVGRFKRFLHGLSDVKQMSNFETIDAPAALLSTVDLSSGGRLWVVISPEQLPEDPGALLAACGEREGLLFEVKQVVYAEEKD